VDRLFASLSGRYSSSRQAHFGLEDCASTSTAGAVYIWHGTPSGSLNLADAAAIVTGENAGDCAGVLPRQPLDLDGDGTKDLLVGAPGHDGAGTDAGAVYVLLGGGI